MTTREQWLNIARRCEEATEPDREINMAISKIATGETGLTPYTASLDAITSLIGEKLPGWQWSMTNYRPKNGGAQAWIYPNNGQSDFRRSATPALALCAAFARAMADMEGA
jgi:hypothetical protein